MYWLKDRLVWGIAELMENEWLCSWLYSSSGKIYSSSYRSRLDVRSPYRHNTTTRPTHTPKVHTERIPSRMIVEIARYSQIARLQEAVLTVGRHQIWELTASFYRKYHTGVASPYRICSHVPSTLCHSVITSSILPASIPCTGQEHLSMITDCSTESSRGSVQPRMMRQHHHP